MITIEDILKYDDAHRETVKVAEWGDAEVTVFSMTAQERSDIERMWSKKDAASDPAAFRLHILERTVKNPDGTTFATPEQFKALMGKNAAAVEKVFEAGCKVSGFSKKDVEEIAKN